MTRSFPTVVGPSHRPGGQADQMRDALSDRGMPEMRSSLHIPGRCGSAEASRPPDCRDVSAATQSARLTARFLRC